MGGVSFDHWVKALCIFPFALRKHLMEKYFETTRRSEQDPKPNRPTLMPSLLLCSSCPPAADGCLGLRGAARSELCVLRLLNALGTFQSPGCLICHIPLPASVIPRIRDPDELSPLAKRHLRKVNSIPPFSS